MRSRELVLVAATLLASATGCLHNPDPRPRSMELVQSDAHGGFAVVSIAGQVAVQGELIAVDPTGVWVLAGGRLIHTPRQQVSKLEIHPYDVKVGPVVLTGILGTVSTISHGFLLIISAPTWIVTSTVIGAVYSRTARETFDQSNWPAIAKWARFPMGMPPGVTEFELLNGRRSPPVPGPPSSVDPVSPSPAPPPPSPPPPPPPPSPR